MMTNLIKATVQIALLFILAQSALADGNIDAGTELGYSCLGCHGIDSYRNAYPSYRVPKLGGQKAAYLVQALKAYRDGGRTHPTMQAQASSLSDQDIDDVAAYLASIDGDTVMAVSNGQPATDAKKLEAAQACTACHGQSGISVNAAWPTIAGQHEDYLLRALRNYRDGSRNDPLMSAQAKLIAEEDVAVLAKYFARLSGLETTKVD